MKLTLFSSVCALGCAAAIAADTAPTAAPAHPVAAGVATNATPITNLIEKASYALGANLGNSLRLQGAEANVDDLVKGLKDGLAAKSKYNDQELRETLMAWQREMRSQRMEKNKKVGDDFLAKKASEPGVKKFPDGMFYKVLVSGKGAQPKAEDRVSAHYKGTLIDGTEFDSSYTRGQPLVSPVRGLIAGWQEALTNMHVGDKWELYIPSQLAYGERGAGPKIGPNSTLIFEMELLGIEPPDTNAPTAAPTINLTPGGGNQPIRVSPGAGNQPIRVQPAPAK